jgi:hypothetical protein
LLSVLAIVLPRDLSSPRNSTTIRRALPDIASPTRQVVALCIQERYSETSRRVISSKSAGRRP